MSIRPEALEATVPPRHQNKAETAEIAEAPETPPTRHQFLWNYPQPSCSQGLTKRAPPHTIAAPPLRPLDYFGWGLQCFRPTITVTLWSDNAQLCTMCVAVLIATVATDKTVTKNDRQRP